MELCEKAAELLRTGRTFSYYFTKGEGTQVWMEFPCHFAGEDGKEMKDESVDNR